MGSCFTLKRLLGVNELTILWVIYGSKRETIMVYDRKIDKRVNRLVEEFGRPESPIAVFPAAKTGWLDAVSFASKKAGEEEEYVT